MKRIATISAIAAAALAATSPASAHVLGVSGAGWSQGFLHPLSGIDHILAMVAVGVWAAQLGRRAVWALPLAFPLVMALGGVLGAEGVPAPWVETGIAGSVAVLGLLIALAARPPLAVAVAVVGLFALFHGHAHGAELPEAASPWLYGLGFVVATVLLHGVGIGIGRLLSRPLGARALRLAGAGVAGVGVALVIAVAGA